MIQSGRVGRQNGVNSDHDGVVFTKLKYRFIVFFGIFSSVFGIFRYLECRLRYRYRYFEIPRYSVSVSVVPTTEYRLPTLDRRVTDERIDGRPAYSYNVRQSSDSR